MILWFRCCAQLALAITLLGIALDAPVACGEPPSEKGVDRLPLLVESVDAPARRPLSTSVKWEGREYDVESGIEVLMGVVRNADSSGNERHYALMRLVMLDWQLKGRPLVGELVGLYDESGDLKGGILLCLMASDDPRGIPVFVRALDKEKDMKLRLSAAGALAHWNVRRGVAELVNLLDSNEVLAQPAPMPYVRDNAMRTFRLTNIRKGWGFPDDKESAEWPPDVMPPAEVMARLKPPPTVEDIRKWFAENEHRFPDWKPGDLLPEVSCEAAEQPSEEPQP